MSKVIGIISIKGGVGKTSTTTALGAALANEFNKKVLLIDGNFSSPNLGLHLGLINPEITIHHVMDGKANIRDAIYETSYGFDVIPGSLNYSRINPIRMTEKINELRRKYDIILIDSSPNLNEEILATMLASNELLMVTTPDMVTLATTLRAIKIAKEKKTPITGIILNKVYNKKFELSLEDIENVSECQVLAVLPHETQIPEALSKNIPSSLNKNTKSTREYKRLAGSLIGEEYKPSKFKKAIRFFLKKVPKQEVNRVVFKATRLDN